MLVVVYSDDAKILLLKRRSPFEFWQSVTGSLNAGETPIECARRELQEETGLVEQGELIDTGVTRSFIIDPRWRDRYPGGVTENTEHEWRYRLPAAIEIEVDEHEHSAYCWMHVDEAIESVWSWTNKAALEELKRQTW